MTNADRFKQLFGLYATELWSMPEEDFLKWLNSEATNCSEIPNNSDTISRQVAIDVARRECHEWRGIFSDIEQGLKELPSTQTERWDTCFDCPLSHGCPVINGCTNEQAMQYAGDIPDNCPLNKTERKIGEWIYYDPNGFKCSRCGRYLEIECGDVKMNFCPHCGSYNGGEHNE